MRSQPSQSCCIHPKSTTSYRLMGVGSPSDAERVVACARFTVITRTPLPYGARGPDPRGSTLRFGRAEAGARRPPSRPCLRTPSPRESDSGRSGGARGGRQLRPNCADHGVDARRRGPRRQLILREELLPERVPRAHARDRGARRRSRQPRAARGGAEGARGERHSGRRDLDPTRRARSGARPARALGRAAAARGRGLARVRRGAARGCRRRGLAGLRPGLPRHRPASRCRQARVDRSRGRPAARRMAAGNPSSIAPSSRRCS